MNKHELTALAERVEAAEGPSRELDELILVLVNPERAGALRMTVKVPAYTASLDAALTLVPEGAKLQFQNFGDLGDRCMWLVSPNERFVSAATPALALTAAALKARANG